jgi:DNA-binding transcriptional ArsR family regulator
MDSTEVIRGLTALAHDTRLAVFRRLIEAGPEGLSVGRIAATVDTSPATLSFHLKELVNAGLISARPDGRFIHYSANYESMDALLAFLTSNCCGGAPCAVAPAKARPRARSRGARPDARRRRATR